MRAASEEEEPVDGNTKETPLQELFIEELKEVKGGAASPWEKIRELLLTTHGMCEETPC